MIYLGPKCFTTTLTRHLWQWQKNSWILRILFRLKFEWLHHYFLHSLIAFSWYKYKTKIPSHLAISNENFHCEASSIHLGYFSIRAFDFCLSSFYLSLSHPLSLYLSFNFSWSIPFFIQSLSLIQFFVCIKFSFRLFVFLFYFLYRVISLEQIAHQTVQ